jgi:aspartate/tyrosine/aromatic aminotransferase
MKKLISNTSFNLLTHSLKYTSFFTKVPLGPPDPIVDITINYNNDTFDKKVNLGVGAYRDDNGKPYVFNIVKKV